MDASAWARKNGKGAVMRFSKTAIVLSLGLFLAVIAAQSSFAEDHWKFTVVNKVADADD
jgi:hypothetical protein